MYKKKISTIAIITILTLSILIAAIPMATAAITGTPGIDIATGPVGTKPTVTGSTAAGLASPFSTVTLYWDNLAGQVLGTTTANATGHWSKKVTIPPATTGVHYIVADDGGGAQGVAFTVTASLAVDVTRALPGDSVVLTGRGYAANDDIVVVLNSTTLTTPVGITITTPTITTNATGSFLATIVIPLTMTIAQYDNYTITATDEVPTSATDWIIIDYYLTLTPATGPTGITTTIAGRIPASTAYDLRFNGAPIATGTSASDGAYSDAYTIPGVLSPATYLVEVVWATSEIRNNTFTVGAAPTITLGATNGVAGLVVTISGSGFSGKATITLYFDSTVVNSTALDSRFGKTSSTGTFSEDFTVPTLAPGIYAVEVVDQYGASNAAGTYFTIDPTPVTSIALRGTSYYPGDIFSFNIYTTEASLGTINVTILDPTSNIWWTTIMWSLTASLSGTYNTVIFQNQGADTYNQMRMMLPADAPLGTWNWTIAYTPISTGVATKATGLFTVSALPTMQTVLDKLVTMEASIKSVVTTTEGDIIAVINTKAGQIITDLSALDAKITSIDGDLVTISTSIGDMQTDIDALDMGTMGVDITSIKGDVATIKTNLGTVTTNVASLAAKVTSLSGDVATVSTNLGTLQGTVTSIDGKVATIDTEVGTVQADIDTVQADVTDIKAKPDVDMTPVWIAVVLSLIAAIAACFAVVTIRQKIAG